MNCAAFEHWLDEGMPESGAPVARAHASGCARCATALRAAEAIETGLMQARFEAPSGLTDLVMARIAAVEAQRARPLAAPVTWRDAFPWWARAAADPATVMAAALCALVVWQWNAIVRTGITAADWMQRNGAGLALPAQSLGMQIALAVILVPASIWLAYAAFRASERWVFRAAGRVAPRPH